MSEVYSKTVPCAWCAYDTKKTGFEPYNDAEYVLEKPFSEDWKYACSGHANIALIAGLQPRPLPKEPTFENMLLGQTK